MPESRPRGSFFHVFHTHVFRAALIGLLAVLALTGAARLSGRSHSAAALTGQEQPATPAVDPEAPREFEGLYFTSFEVEAFQEGADCPTRREEAAWLEATRDSDFYTRVRAFRAEHPDVFPNAPFGRYHVRFIGVAAPEGHYGHLAAYTRKVTVLEVLDIAAAEDCELTLPPAAAP